MRASGGIMLAFCGAETPRCGTFLCLMLTVKVVMGIVNLSAVFDGGDVYFAVRAVLLCTGAHDR